MTAYAFNQPIQRQIWEGKYKLVTPNPDIDDDHKIEDTWKRIAQTCASTEPEMTTPRPDFDMNAHYEKWYPQYLEALTDFNFLPAGRITAGAGSGRNVTLFNCYVMGTIPDDMGGIFDMLREAALTMQQGGGIGYDFSTIRPKGAPVKGVDADASGALSFMDVWDAMCRTIMSAGARRGAMMATMKCTHPDVIDFITAKRERGRLNMFNMSVLATDDFMSAVVNGDDWALTHKVAPAEPVKWTKFNEYGDMQTFTMIGDEHIYEVVDARDLWDLIMGETYHHAEPGVLFIDRINKMNNLWFMEEISATNPCGEQPLPPYGACLLGSINLAKMVSKPFTDHAQIDYDKIRRIARIATRMLDSIIDVSNFPLPQQKLEAKLKRRMGIGITGLGDMLYMIGSSYGSDQAQDITELVMKTIAIASYEESIQMAHEFGPCPATEEFENRVSFCKSGNMQDMPSKIRDGVMRNGIRNALLTSVAPTGTISLYAGNVSSGVEPVFSPGYTRRVLEDDGVTERFELVTDYAVLEYNKVHGLDAGDFITILTEPWAVTAQTLTPEDHLNMQAAVQKWVDSSISKTINLPEDISFEDFQQVYLDAYEKGCKGCTTYRPNDILGSVISVDKTDKDEPEESLPEPEPDIEVPTARGRMLDGQTYKLKWANKNFYVTINNDVIDGQIAPFEIFINTQDMTNFQWITALTRMMSSIFRRGGDITFMVEDLKSIMDPNGGQWVDGAFQPSFIAYLGQVLKLHIDMLQKGLSIEEEYLEVDFAHEKSLEIQELDRTVPYVDPHQPGAESRCPECGDYAMTSESGCPTCKSCGHSKCG